MTTDRIKLVSFGLGRSGTNSVQAASDLLGFKIMHHKFGIKSDTIEANEWFEKMIQAHKSKFIHKTPEVTKKILSELANLDSNVTAITAFMNFPSEMYDLFPDALFILPIRDSPDAWAKSVQTSIVHMMLIFHGFLFQTLNLGHFLPAPVKFAELVKYMFFNDSEIGMENYSFTNETGVKNPVYGDS